MQCRAGMGACPDTMDSSGTCSNDVTDVTGFVADGQQCVAFTRPFSTCKRLLHTGKITAHFIVSSK